MRKTLIYIFLLGIVMVAATLLYSADKKKSKPEPQPSPTVTKEEVVSQLPITSEEFAVLPPDPGRSESIIVQIKGDNRDKFFEVKTMAIDILRTKFNLSDSNFCDFDIRFVPTGDLAYEIKDSEVFFKGCPLPDWVRS